LTKKYKSIFISDVHLGTSDSQAKELLEFLKDNESENLYLVGDIIDGWALRRKFKWLQSHSDVIQKILRKARKGTKIYYVLGNHDEFVRPFLPLMLGDNIYVANEFDYIDTSGKRYLVTHGDFFDSITMTKKWLALLGDQAYMFTLKINRPINYIRELLGYRKYWSLSQYLKQNVKKSVNFITDYEQVLSKEAIRGDYDGVVCGHIHHAEIRYIDGIHYLNCGDWVESASALVETLDGEWKLLRFYAD
jgi:UDP-2,3-diacylglucosamine pyrophosphatase LpxH